ncbi:MAG: hypothetical protein KAU58_05335 [Candidatus Omnitrophica bacterium]|nr:hypothetical protein [Candidatus Omnitrophota bacterium]
MKGGEEMNPLLLEKRDSNAMIDFRNNIERLRKIRDLNIKDIGKIRNSERQGKNCAQIRPY